MPGKYPFENIDPSMPLGPENRFSRDENLTLDKQRELDRCMGLLAGIRNKASLLQSGTVDDLSYSGKWTDTPPFSPKFNLKLRHQNPFKDGEYTISELINWVNKKPNPVVMSREESIESEKDTIPRTGLAGGQPGLEPDVQAPNQDSRPTPMERPSLIDKVRSALTRKSDHDELKDTGSD